MALLGPGSSGGNSTRVHSLTGYSRAADCSKWHRDSAHGSRPRHCSLSLRRATCRPRPAGWQIASASPDPSDLSVGCSSVCKPRRGPLLPPRQRRWPEPSTRPPYSPVLFAGSQSPQCLRSTGSHRWVAEVPDCRLCPGSTHPLLSERCLPAGRGRTNDEVVEES